MEGVPWDTLFFFITAGVDTKMTKPLDILQEHFALDTFREPQEEIIETTLQGKDSLVLMPTGMGKSLCYQVPAMMLEGLTLVISPLIALMKDQVDSLKAKGIQAEFINSSLTKPERKRRMQAMQDGRYNLVYIAPERFRNEEFTSTLKNVKVSLLAVDEAHCISQWGNDFRPAYSQVGQFRRQLGNPVTMALTATATPRVQEDILTVLGLDPGEVKTFNLGINRPNLYLASTEVIDRNEKYSLLEKTIKTTQGNGIVYFNLIKDLDEFSRYCEERKIPHGRYHGKMNPTERSRQQERFINSTGLLMLATNAFGMGIDKADIRYIIHADIPGSPESYYQEIGRAGRDGNPSLALLVYSQDDLAVQMQFIDWANPGPGFCRDVLKTMKSQGDGLVSLTYEDLQEMVVFKNRGDHRLKTVLSTFDRYGVTTGSLDNHTLKLTGEYPDELDNQDFWDEKKKHDLMKLYDILQYTKTGTCKRDYLHAYFGLPSPRCGSCDICVPGNFHHS